MDFLKNYDIILASNSPRRKELLAGLDIPYRVCVLPDIDESYPDTLRGEEIPLYISRQKAAAHAGLLDDIPCSSRPIPSYGSASGSMANRTTRPKPGPCCTTCRDKPTRSSPE